MSNEESVTIAIDAISSKSSVGQVTLRQKSAFAVQHLMAADRFSRQCGEVQKSNIGKPLGPFYDEQIACVSAAIMLCVASIESNINEYLSEPKTLLPELESSLRMELCALISKLSIVDKYQRILSSKGIPIFERGELPLQDVEILISLRNELVHFHPEWHDEQERHRKLGLKLKGKFELSPFISENTGVFFPQRIVSHGCTKWAVKTSYEFMNEFCFRLGIESKFRKHEGKFSA